MKRIILAFVAMGLGTSASAAALIGSKASFVASAYCNQQRCQFYNTQPFSSSLREEAYYLRTEFQGTNAPDVYVLRDSGRVVSIGYGVGVQDSPFVDDAKDFSTNQFAELIRLATGTRPSNGWVAGLECGDARTGKEAIRRWKGLGQTYTVTCVSYPGNNFHWNQFRVF